MRLHDDNDFDSEEALIALALREDCDAMRASARVPDAGRIWWMAQLRARREAVEAARRPIVAVETAAAVCAVVMICVLGMFGMDNAWPIVARHAALAGGMLAAVVGVPLLVYLAAGSD